MILLKGKISTTNRQKWYWKKVKVVPPRFKSGGAKRQMWIYQKRNIDL